MSSRISRLSTVLAFTVVTLASIQASAQTRTWNGVGDGTNWTNAQNWVEGFPPASGASLVFPSGPSALSPNNNTAAGILTLSSISISGAGYTLTGSPVDVTGNISYSTASSSPSVISLDVALKVGPHLIQGDDVAFLQFGNLDVAADSVSFSGNVAVEGTLSSLSTTNPVFVSSGYLKLVGGSSSFSRQIQVLSGANVIVEGDYILGNGTLQPQSGSTAFLAAGSKFSFLNSSGDLHLGNITPSSTATGRFDVTNLNFSGGSLTIDINGPGAGSGYDQIYVQDGFALGSATTLNLRKAAGYTPPGGTRFDIVFLDYNTCQSCLGSGTFAGLTNGDIVNVGGTDFKVFISSAGVTLEVPSATRVWSGGGRNNNWSNGSNWQGGLPPVAGSDLIFPTDVSSTTPVNDLTPGFPINHIEVVGGYTISGNDITLTNGIDVVGGFGGTSTVISLPITFSGEQTVTAAAPLELTGDLQVSGLVILTGDIHITGDLAGAGGLAAQGAGTDVRIETTSSMTGTIQSQVSATLRFKGSHAGPLSVQSDSTLEFEGSAGQLLASGLLVIAGDNETGNAAASNITFGTSTVVRLELVGVGSFDSMQGSSVNLGNAQLDLRTGGFVPAPGSSFTILAKSGAAPVTGTFKNLPQGAAINLGGLAMLISYTGGDGNDVVLTAAGGCSASIVAPSTVKANSTGNTAAVAVPVGGSSYNWAITNGTITAGQGTPQIVWTAGPAGTVQINLAVTGACSANGTHMATIETLPASVILSSNPSAIVLTANSGTGGSTSYTLTNIGDVSTNVSLTQNGSFFTQAPASFAIAGGGSQTITISVGPQTQNGTNTGASLPQGSGVPVGLSVPVKLLVAPPPTAGTPNVIATIDRIDVSAARGQNPRGSATFQNIGTAIATGVPSSDVPWIIPDPTGVISIPQGGTISIGFTIDRSQRPDGTQPTGSVLGTLSFVYSTTRAGARQTLDGSPSLSASVPVSDTVKPPTSNSVIPPLAQGEVALLVPGVGNVVGSGGKLFVSDMTLLNRSPLSSVPDAKLFYIAPDGQTTQANLDSISPSGSVSLANVVSTVFNKSQQVGTMMIRSSQVSNMVVNATIFNDNNPKGRYGTVIPILRSDRAVSPGQRLVIGGMKRDATSHTNVYVQEMSGTLTFATARFLDANANQVGQSLPLTIQPFALTQAVFAVPPGAVTAVITNDSGGKILSYATPVDDAEGGGDTWAQADWNRQYSMSGTEPLLVPVAGAAPGANNTYFRTDLAITNTGSSTSTAKVRYTAGALVVEKSVNLAPLATSVLDDVVAVFLGVTPPSIGSIVVTPQGGTFTVTSRTYSSTQGSLATFGTATPTVALGSGLVAGQSRLIAGLEDSKLSTVNAKTPKTARTNFGFVETKGQPAKVKVSLLLNDGRSLAFGQAKGSITIDLAANQFLLVPSMTKTILGDARETQFGDLKNVMVKFEVIGGTGGVVPFVTSTDNGTGDTILRNE